MKVLLTLLCIVSSAYASAIYEYAPPATLIQEAKVTTGVSSQSRAQDNHGNYAFSYKEDHAEGGTFRKESGNAHGQVIGSYGLRDRDGRVRIVNYVADDGGFRAAIATNEPGTAAQPAAATSISTPHAVAVAAPALVEDVHAAPVQVAEQLVAAPHAQTVAIENHGPIHQAPLAVAAPVAPVHVAAPAQLIKTYATSIYGPSLLTDNVIFKTIPRKVTSYVPPLNSPEAYGVPSALQTHDGAGYYEPTLVYSNPSGAGYALGTNVGQFGYQLTYKKKKK